MSQAPAREEISQEVDKGQFNPMNDAIFKHLFGAPERKLYTIDLLNSILEEPLIK